MAETKTLFERLGGQPAIKSVVDRFYVYMLDDARVNQFFKNIDMNHQRSQQTNFITLVTGGPNSYQGKDMKEAHLNMAIGNGEFDATWENLLKSLGDHKVAEGLITELKEVFYSVQEDIVTK